MKLCLCLGLIASAALVVSQSPRLATRIPRKLLSRAEFYGGWPLISLGCPSGTVSCGKGCCPTGQNCHKPDYDPAYCCPDENNCHDLLSALPVCADPSWDLFESDGSLWCCLSGQVGVSSFLCANSSLNIPTSKLASSVSEISDGPGTRSAGTTFSNSRTTTKATITSATGDASGSSSSSSSNSSSGSSRKIAVAAIIISVIIGVAVIIFLVWFYLGRVRRIQQNPTDDLIGSNVTAGSPPAMQEPNQTVSPAPQQLEHQHTPEIDSGTRIDGRAELEHGGKTQAS